MSLIHQYIDSLKHKVRIIEDLTSEFEVPSERIEFEDTTASIRFDLEELEALLYGDRHLCRHITLNPVTDGPIACEREAGHFGNHANLAEPLTWR